ncbi:MFS transporter [Hahella ganghwensis]|uniref:MFS transporter n=1 Tax=Hahella ganghwensis TaxID=286420 RepID=UPI000372F68A|nr:MFS transporter [Hahella ganghwensis]
MLKFSQPSNNAIAILAGVFSNNLALGIYTLSLGKLLFDASGAVQHFATIMVIEQVLFVLLGMLAGNIVDSFKTSLIAGKANLVFALACFLLVACVYTGGPEGISLTGASLMIGMMFSSSRAFFRPALFRMPPEVVSEGQLQAFNARMTVCIQSGQLIGAAAAGVLIGLGTIEVPLLISGVLYALAAVIFLISPLPYAVQRKKGGSLLKVLKDTPRSWVSPIKVAWGDKSSFYTLVTVGADFLTISLFNLLLAPWCEILFNGVYSWMGGLEMAFAIGAILGGWILTRKLNALAPSSARQLGLLLQALAWAASFILISPWGFIAIACCLGMGVAISSTSVLTLLQASLPREIHGRAGVIRSIAISVSVGVLLPVLTIQVESSIKGASVLMALFLGVFMMLAILPMKQRKPINTVYKTE